jgi:glycosidase
MAEMVPVEFWGWAISQVKQQYPGVIFIAEVYNPSQYRNYLFTGKFDYLYDKVGLYDTLRAVMTGHAATGTITHCWQSVNDILPNMLNFLENHDEQRIASDFFAGNSYKGRPALAVSALMSTNPLMVYSGQEWGERGMDAEGFSGCDGRTTIFDYWSIPVFRAGFTDKKEDLCRYYTQILQLCRQSPAIHSGKFFDLMYVNPDLAHKQYAFLRYAENELLLVVANFDEERVNLNIFIPAHAFDSFGISDCFDGKAKDLLTKRNCAAVLHKDTFYPVRVEALNAVVIRFPKKY